MEHNQEEEIEIIDIDDHLTDDIDESDYTDLEEPVVSQPNPKQDKKQKVDQLINEGGSQALQKMGVPKSFADAAVKKNGGTFSPANMPGSKIISNKAKEQLAKSLPSNDSKKIQDVLGKHPNMPGISNNRELSEEKEETKKEQLEKRAASIALTAASGGALNGSAADMAASMLIEKRKKIRRRIIIASITPIIIIIFLIVCFLGGFSTDDDLGKNTNGYITGQMTEEELLEQLEYYGYCKDKATCKKQGAYQFFQKLKMVYELSSQPCSNGIQNNVPCGITLNTALIIETINYYDNATDNFETYDKTEEELNIFQSFISFFKRAKKEKQQLDTMLQDIDDLVIAQSEYVKESCRYLSQYEKEQDLKDGKVNNAKNKYTNSFYQISFDKYVSYLKYGNSSNHPNYQGKPVEIENEICIGPDHDYIATNYHTNTDFLTQDPETNQYSVNGTGKGVDIANYALQFVGNPYVYGGVDLINGVDCSGFTMKVMEHFGITIPHNSNQQAEYGTNMGTNVNDALPGDLIVYNGHVAIYLGNNSIVHASSVKTGIKISNNASYRTIVAIVRLWG